MNRMKKHMLLGGMLLCAAAFTSCNEDFDNWASPQSNVPGADVAPYGITVAPGSQSNIVMDNATENSQIIAVSTKQKEVASIELRGMTINGVNLPYTYEKGAVSVNTQKLDSLVEISMLDRSATPHAVTVKTLWSAVLATGEAVPFESETEITLTPYSNTPKIDVNGYVLLGDFASGMWDKSNPVRMTQVEPGVYQALVTTKSEGDNWYKFYSGTPWAESADPDWGAVDGAAMGCEINGDGTSPNLLVWKDDPRFGKFETPVIKGAGDWLVTIDMNKLYFKYEPKETKYYVVGEPNGWSTDNKNCLFYAQGGNVYNYTTYWPNQWSLKIWDQDHFGDWAACWGGVNGSTEAKGTLVNSDAGAFGPSESGAWAILTINMGTKEYEWTIIEEPTTYQSISLIGGFNEWSGDVDLTQLEKAPHNWYVRYTLESDTELKFRANHNWDTKDWGSDGSGEINEEKYYVTPGGGNIKVPAGTYDFYLNDITGNWSIAWVAAE
jgi:hypothetical protein